MAIYYSDSVEFHLRQFIDLDPGLAADLEARGNTGRLVLVADRIMLSGAKFHNRDVILIANTVEAGVSGLPLELTRTGAASAGVLIQEGLTHPETPVQGTPPGTGAKGHSLTVICRALLGGHAESRGQRGGKGLKGPRRTTSFCVPPTGESPCIGMTPAQLKLIEGDPGGQGLPGGAGGEGGAVSVFLVRDLANNAASWRGTGGAGGEGGDGGTGSAGGNTFATPGGPGPLGPEGPVPTAVPATFTTITEAEFLARVRPVKVIPTELLGPGVPQSSVADLWAEFKRRQAAARLRSPLSGGGARRLLDEAGALAPDTENSLTLRRLARNRSNQFGIELDLDLVGGPEVYETALAPTREAMLATVLPLFPVPGEGDVPKLLITQGFTSSLSEMRTRLAGLLPLSGGEFTVQRSEADARVHTARSARQEAHRSRVAASDRLAARLTPLPTGLTVQIPAAGISLDAAGVQALRLALLELAPQLAIDDVADPNPPAGPSGDSAVLLPTDPRLLVHTSVRDAGPHLVYPPETPSPPAVYGLAGRASWPKALQAGTGDAIDLTLVTADLREALRSVGAQLPADPLLQAVLSDLTELAEATHLWRLADLRIEQATESAALLGAAEAEARAALAELPFAPTGAKKERLPYLRGLQALGDLLSWRTQRAHRAHDIYTLDLTPVDIPRTLNDEQFDPDDVADLTSDPHGAVVPSASDAARAAQTLIQGMADAGSTSITSSVDGFHKRGREVTKFLANRVFCAQPGDGCAVATPHVFQALNNPLQSNFWLDVDLADVQGAHREAKTHGAVLRFTYDLTGGQPAETFLVELVHQGLSRQRQFGADTVHHQRGLPRPAPIPLTRLPGEPGAPTAVWEGSVVVDGGGAATFPAYGRGVAAGYRVRLTDASQARPDLLTRVEVMIQYEARQDENITNLRDVSLGTGLRPGVAAAGLVTLTGPAPAGGVKVRLRSTDQSVLAVPAEITVPAGSDAASFAAQVLKPTGPVPPRLTASTLDGVNRHALVPVAAAPPALTKSVVVGGEGTTFAVALGRPPASPGGPRPEPRIYLTHTPAGSPDEPAGPGPGNSVHVFRPDLTELVSREIGFWPRSIDVDEARGRLYVLHGDTLSLLDSRTLVTKAERLIGINASSVAVDAAAQLVYVTRYSHGTVHVLRGADLSVVEVFGTTQTLRGCLGIAFDPARSLIYTARNFRIADPTATAITRIVRTAAGAHVIDRDVTVGPALLQPQSIAVDAAARLVFVGCLGGGGVHPELLVLDADTLQVLHRVTMPRGVQSVAARDGSGIAYAVTSEGLHLIDGRTGTLAQTITAGVHPQGLAVDAVTGSAYVVGRTDHRLTRIETPTSVAPRVFR